MLSYKYENLHLTYHAYKNPIFLLDIVLIDDFEKFIKFETKKRQQAKRQKIQCKLIRSFYCASE